jgi:hypothetical protein
VRRLRRTGPSSSRRVRSRARWRSYHEAASVASHRSINVNLATIYILFHLRSVIPPALRPRSQPLGLVATVLPLPPPSSHSPLHLSRLVWFTLIWTILLATFNPISHLYTSRVMQYHSIPCCAVLPTLTPSSPIIYPLRCITVYSSSHSRTASSCLVSHRSLL